MKKTLSRRSLLRTAATLPVVAGLRAPLGAQDSTPGRSRGLRFAIASDGHFGQPGTDFKRHHAELIQWLNLEAKGKGLDFVIFNGDLIHDQPEFLPLVKEAYGPLQVPYFTVKGNHDKVSPEAWKECWGIEQNHDFARGDSAFLLGCTSNENGEYLSPDLPWLRSALERHASKATIFVFLHIAQHPFTKHGISSPEATALLEGTPNVAAIFHGHDHNLDNVIYSGGKAHFFDGHFGGNWGTNYRGYRIVELSDLGRWNTYQCNPAAFYVNQDLIG